MSGAQVPQPSPKLAHSIMPSCHHHATIHHSSAHPLAQHCQPMRFIRATIHATNQLVNIINSKCHSLACAHSMIHFFFTALLWYPTAFRLLWLFIFSADAATNVVCNMLLCWWAPAAGSLGGGRRSKCMQQTNVAKPPNTKHLLIHLRTCLLTYDWNIKNKISSVLRAANDI